MFFSYWICFEEIFILIQKREMPKTILTFSFLLFTIWGYAQNTIGLTAYTADSENGYTLFSPNQSNDVFLIDNCGQLVHSWTTNVRPGLSCYLLENGNLLRTKKIVQPYFNGGGVGGGATGVEFSGDDVDRGAAANPRGLAAGDPSGVLCPVCGQNRRIRRHGVTRPPVVGGCPACRRRSASWLALLEPR